MILLSFAYQGLFLVSHFFTRNAIDDSVIYHLKYGLGGAGYSEYIDLILFVSAGLFFSFFLSFLFGRWLSNHFGIEKATKRRNYAIAYVLIIIGLLTSPTTYDLWKYVKIYSTSLEIPRLPFSKNYIKDEVILSGEQKRNLLYIYVESLERTYFDEEHFPGLIKELRRLEDRATIFTNIEQVRKTGWTIGGITASQCGIPLAIPSHGNSMNGVDTFLSEAKCIGDYLSAVGYKLSMMMGSSKEFSGLEKMLTSHGFSSIHDGPNDLMKQVDDSDYINGWGLYDDTLFTFAEQALNELNKLEEPYALFLSTMDTHHPRGHPSKSCDGIIYEDGSNSILNAVACSDRLVSDFVNRALDSEYADNLVIVIASDHLAMGNTATDLLESVGKRENLFMIIEPQLQGVVVENRGSMLDVGSSLLPFLGFEGRIGLGRDLRKESSLLATYSDFNKLLKNWEPELIALWKFPRIELGTPIYIDTIKEVVTIKGREFKYPLLIEIDSKGDSVFRFNFNRSKGHKTLTKHLLELDDETPFLLVDTCEVMANKHVEETEHCLVYGKTSTEQINKLSLKGNVSMLGADLYHSSSGFVPRTKLQVELDSKDKKRFIAHAGGMIDGNTYTSSLEALDNSYLIGFRLFELDIIVTSDRQYVAAHDWKHWSKKTGYEGEIPPSHKDFMNHSIFKLYTPLDMEGINRWFSLHPDAILVTDKVNEPARFSGKFIDKNRLMMELFSENAVIEGLEVGILSAMPNWSLINKGLSPSRLQDMGVNSVAVSRRKIADNLSLLKELKERGINVYVYHVNFDTGKDEEYVICHDMNFIYGLYSDSYDFNQLMNCDGYH